MFGPEEDGWLLVQDKDDGKVGYVPGNYIEAVDDAGSTAAVPSGTPHIVVSDSPYRHARPVGTYVDPAELVRSSASKVKSASARRRRGASVKDVSVGVKNTQSERRNAKMKRLWRKRGALRMTKERRSLPQELSVRLARGTQIRRETQTREWHDRTGQFRVETTFLGYKNGVLRLHKVDGVVIGVEDCGRGHALRREDQWSCQWRLCFMQEWRRRRAKRRQSLQTVPAPTKKAPPVDWFEFFLNTGCDVDDCTRYASSFERDKIDEAILPDITEGTLRTLGLREGDIIRVAKVIEVRRPKPPTKAASSEVNLLGGDEVGGQRGPRPVPASQTYSPGQAGSPRTRGGDARRQARQIARTTTAATPRVPSAPATQLAPSSTGGLLAKTFADIFRSACAAQLAARTNSCRCFPEICASCTLARDNVSPGDVRLQSWARRPRRTLRRLGRTLQTGLPPSGARGSFAPVLANQGLLTPLVPTTTGFTGFAPTRPTTSPSFLGTRPTGF
ncbi:hypothetical protein EDB89DRAFT_2162340 [Lactarius sanguifluus]|nr:hypothetical protein EDB89DRAFT_2162340 [Lactarius sanguifluus]